jgi:hypothetical protein
MEARAGSARTKKDGGVGTIGEIKNALYIEMCVCILLSANPIGGNVRAY